MFINTCHRVSKLTIPTKTTLSIFREPGSHKNLFRVCYRTYYKENEQSNEGRTTQSRDLVQASPREIFEREFPNHYNDGKFISRVSYVDFIDQALGKMKELGLDRNIEAYKELLRVFPPKKYHPKSRWDLGLFHAPQQLCAIRLLTQMENSGVKTDKEVEKLVVDGFSKNSAVWLKVARMNFWSMKGRNIDPYPIPEKIPTEHHEIARHALIRMLDDPKAVIKVSDASLLPDTVDKTWIAHAQSPIQKSIIGELSRESILYIENCGLTFVGDKYLTYFSLKVYDDDEEVKRRAIKAEPDWNFNKVKMKFYGKPLEEKLRELKEMYHVDNGYVLALGLTGTSSQDSVLSWLKLMQRENPNLENLNVVFKMKMATPELLDPNADFNLGQENKV